MKIYPFYSVRAFSNTYLLGPEGGGDAILVDPGAMDVALLQLIEEHNYSIRWILLTHAHAGHCGGIPTVMKIYRPEILAAVPEVLGFPTTTVLDGQQINLGSTRIRCREVPGHSGDSICYLVNDHLFAGDVLGAGTVGPTPNAYARALLVRGIKDLLKELDPTTKILPGHGPPTSTAIERAVNPGLRPALQDAPRVP